MPRVSARAAPSAGADGHHDKRARPQRQRGGEIWRVRGGRDHRDDMSIRWDALRAAGGGMIRGPRVFACASHGVLSIRTSIGSWRRPYRADLTERCAASRRGACPKTRSVGARRLGESVKRSHMAIDQPLHLNSHDPLPHSLLEGRSHGFAKVSVEVSRVRQGAPSGARGCKGTVS